MRRTSRALLAAALVGVAVGAAGCSDPSSPTGPASPAPSTAGSTPTAGSATTAGSTPTTSASPSLAVLPVAQCLTGDWRLVRFVAASNQTYGTGQGGDLTLAFDRGSYTLTGTGTKAMVLTTGGQTGDLRVDGKAKGGYTVEDANATFGAAKTSGKARLENASGSASVPMAAVVKVLGLEGAGQVACTDQAMTITLSRVRLELARL